MRIDDAYANHLCKRGLRVVMVQHWTDDTTVSLDLGMHDRGSMRMTAAVLDVINFIAPKSPEQLGILGTSVGAISASLILGLDSRIQTGVLIVSGVGMAEIIANSDEKGLSKLRIDRMKAFGYTDKDAYARALMGAVLIELSRFVATARRKNVLSYLALEDKTVPTKNQWDLYHALGSGELVQYRGDHYHTILHTGFKLRSDLDDYFAAHLKPGVAGSPLGAPDLCNR